MSPRDKLHLMQPMRAFLRGSLVEHPSQRPRPKPRRPVCLLFPNLDSWDTLRFTILILIYPWKLTLQAVTPEEQEKKDFQKDLSQWCTQESMESFHYRFQGLVFLIGLRISQLGNKARLAAQALTKHGITNQEAITNVHIYIYTLKKINISFVRMDKPWRLIQLMTFAIPAQLTLLLCKATKTASGDCHAKVQQYLKKPETKFHNQPRPYFTVVQLLDNS